MPLNKETKPGILLLYDSLFIYSIKNVGRHLFIVKASVINELKGLISSLVNFEFLFLI